MALKDYCGTVAVGTVVTIISGAADREICSVFNDGAGTVYLGSGTALTAANGYPVLVGEAHHWLGDQDIYAISASGTNLLRIHEVV